MKNEYKTIKYENSDEFIINKSRFICYAKPVKTQDEASAFISSIKQKHWDASHNVSAYVLKDGFVQRSSDDGEPSSTAGMPMLNVLLNEKIFDACVVVTRYFGGVLLGTGGLVRAYSHGAKLALESAEIITMAQCSIFALNCDYSYFDRINVLLSEYSAKISDTKFEENIKITFSLKKEFSKKFKIDLTELTGGKFCATFLKEEFSEV